jgi:hypothetical protein
MNKKYYHMRGIKISEFTNAPTIQVTEMLICSITGEEFIVIMEIN